MGSHSCQERQSPGSSQQSSFRSRRRRRAPIQRCSAKLWLTCSSAAGIWGSRWPTLRQRNSYRWLEARLRHQWWSSTRVTRRYLYLQTLPGSWPYWSSSFLVGSFLLHWERKKRAEFKSAEVNEWKWRKRMKITLWREDTGIHFCKKKKNCKKK